MNRTLKYTFWFFVPETVAEAKQFKPILKNSYKAGHK